MHKHATEIYVTAEENVFLIGWSCFLIAPAALTMRNYQRFYSIQENLCQVLQFNWLRKVLLNFTRPWTRPWMKDKCIAQACAMDG